MTTDEIDSASDQVCWTPEAYFVPDGDTSLLYLPVKGKVYRLADSLAIVIQQLRAREDAGIESAPAAVRQLLWELDLLDPAGAARAMPARSIERDFSPVGVVLLATTLCNFRCRYCYADAGDYEPQLFARDVADAAIRTIVDNAARLGEATAHLSFHGGGEPTADFGLIRFAVERARSYARETTDGAVAISAGLVTNGFIPDAKAEWLAANMQSVQVSLDGPAHIQDAQRPLQNGAATHDGVVRTIKTLERQVPALIIKSTISARSVHHMPEIAEFMCSTFSLPRFHFGPVIGSGRGRDAEYGEPDALDFFEGYLQAQEVADRHGRVIAITGSQQMFPDVSATYCGVTDPNFAVNVNGTVTSCYEVIYDDDPRAHQFHFGHYDPEAGSFAIDMDRMVALRSADVTTLAGCQDCYAKWQCAGDCRARWHDAADDARRMDADVRCRLNRLVIKHELQKSLAR